MSKPHIQCTTTDSGLTTRHEEVVSEKNKSRTRIQLHHSQFVHSCLSKPHIQCTTTDSGLNTTTSSLISPTTITKKTSSESRLLAENRELIKFKKQFQILEEESRKGEQVDRSLHNKATLDKYSVKHAKEGRAKKMTTHDRTSSKTSAPANVIVGIPAARANEESWEVAPDPSKPIHEITEEEVAGDNISEAIVRVLNHRKKTGGRPEMLTEWDNGERIWTDVKFAFLDAAMIVATYIADNDLSDTAFEPQDMKRGKTDKTATAAQMEQMKCSQEGRTDKTPRKRQAEQMKFSRDGKTLEDKEEQIKCSHDDYRTEIGGYQPEPDSRYFVSKYDMEDCCCVVCHSKFVPVGQTTNKQFRPSILKPAFICANRFHGCYHCVCFDCFMTKNMSSEGSKRCRSTRNNK